MRLPFTGIKKVTERIIERCKQIVQQALLTETAVTFRETIGEKLDKHLLVQESENLIKEQRFEELDSTLAPIPLAVSYDMGW